MNHDLLRAMKKFTQRKVGEYKELHREKYTNIENR
jgi:hypothetical protein